MSIADFERDLNLNSDPLLARFVTLNKLLSLAER